MSNGCVHGSQQDQDLETQGSLTERIVWGRGRRRGNLSLPAVPDQASKQVYMGERMSVFMHYPVSFD